jgi:hypothetical protein
MGAGFTQGFAPLFFDNGWIAKAVSDGVLDSFYQVAILAGRWPTLACVDAFSSSDFRGEMAACDLPTLMMRG